MCGVARVATGAGCARARRRTTPHVPNQPAGARGGLARGKRGNGQDRLQGHSRVRAKARLTFPASFPRRLTFTEERVEQEGGRARREARARARATFRGDRRRAREGEGRAAVVGPGSGSLDEAPLLSLPGRFTFELGHAFSRDSAASRVGVGAGEAGAPSTAEEEWVALILSVGVNVEVNEVVKCGGGVGGWSAAGQGLE